MFFKVHDISIRCTCIMYIHIIGGVLKIFANKMHNPNYLSIIELGIKEPQNLALKERISQASLNSSQSLKQVFIFLS